MNNKEDKLIELFYTVTSDDIFFNIKHIVNYIENYDLLIPIKLERKENSIKFAKMPLVKWKSTDKERVIQVLKSEYPCGIAIILDNYDFVILDIDNVELFEQKVVKIEELLNERNYIACVRTISGGFHFYLKRSEYEKLVNFNQINNKELLENYGFELRYQGLLLVPGSLTSQFESYKLIDINFDPKTTIINYILNYLLSEEQQEQQDVNITKLAKQVLSKVKFDDLQFLRQLKVKEYGHYSTYHCPLHTPDNYPSFAVYKNEGKEIAVDFHDYKKYNVITFLAKYKNISVRDAILELAKELELVKEDQAKEDQAKERKGKKKKMTIQDIDIELLKSYFLSIFEINDIEYYFDEKRVKFFRFHTKETYFDLRAVDFLFFDNFLRSYFNYHTRIPKAWYYLEDAIRDQITVFFDVIANEIAEKARFIDMNEDLADKIINCIKLAPIESTLEALTSDFLVIVKHEDKMIFTFSALQNTLSKIYSIKLTNNNLSFLLKYYNIAESYKQLQLGRVRVRTWALKIEIDYIDLAVKNKNNEQMIFCTDCTDRSVH